MQDFIDAFRALAGELATEVARWLEALDPATLKWPGAVLLAVLFGLLLFGLHQYQAHDRTWGLQLVLWAVGVALLVGVGLRFHNVLTLGWLVGGFFLAYLAGWRWLGRKRAGWRRHAIRAAVFAACLGPLAAVPGWALPELRGWLEMWLHVDSLAEPVTRLVYALPGVYLVGALAFLASMLSEAVGEDRLPTGRLKVAAIAVMISLLPVLNWYAAGFVHVGQAIEDDRTGLLRYAVLSRPGNANCYTFLRNSGLPWQPLDLAAVAGSAAAVRILIDAGARVNERPGWSHALLVAVSLPVRDPEVVEALLAAGADPNSRGAIDTALHFAARRSAMAVQALIRAGAAVDATTEEGYTPLHIAAWNGHPQPLNALLGGGANINARVLGAGKRTWSDGNEGKTPLDLTQDRSPYRDPKGQDECGAILRAAGGKTGAELDAEKPQPAQVPAQPEPGR